jgi:RNA polymerase sigma factor (sigma-70 family)
MLDPIGMQYPGQSEGRSEERIVAILQRMAEGDVSRAWSGFLELYAPVLMQVAQFIARDQDAAGDCFLFICERLSLNGCRRLRQFRVGGGASFGTWLRAVARNLALDWRRAEVGRHRVFASVERLPELEQEVYAELFSGSTTDEAAFFRIAARRPDLTRDSFEQALRNVHAALTPRHRWLLSRRNGARRMAELDGGAEPVPLLEVLRDSAPDPEQQACSNQQKLALAGALSEMPREDRLLLRLRYEEDLTLAQTARLAGLKDAQTAHRRVEAALDRLKNLLTTDGNARKTSV